MAASSPSRTSGSLLGRSHPANTGIRENPIPRDALTNAEAPPRMISSSPASIPLLSPLSLSLSLCLPHRSHAPLRG